MEWEAAGEGEEEGDQDQREGDHRGQDVGGEEDPEIDEAGGAVAGEAGVAVEGVVGDVGDEEEGGEEEGREHGVAVLDEGAAADVAVADEQGDGAEAVEEGVEGGEEGEMDVGGVDGMVEVDQPAEEGRGGQRDGDDPGDGVERRFEGERLGRGGCGHDEGFSLNGAGVLPEDAKGGGVGTAGEEDVQGPGEDVVFRIVWVAGCGGLGEERDGGVELEIVREAEDAVDGALRVGENEGGGFAQAGAQDGVFEEGDGLREVRDGVTLGGWAGAQALNLREDEPHPVAAFLAEGKLRVGLGVGGVLGLEEAVELRHGAAPVSTGLKPDAALGVEDHGGEQEGKIDDARLEQVPGDGAGFRGCGVFEDRGEANGVPEVDGRGQGGEDGIGQAGEMQEGGPEGDGDHEDGVEEGLEDGGAGGPGDGLLGGGEADAAVAVVVAVHPADGHEVRELPDEEDGEEGYAGPLDEAAGGGPADEGRESSGEGADEGVEAGDALERGVDGDVEDGGEEGKGAGEEVGFYGEEEGA